MVSFGGAIRTATRARRIVRFSLRDDAGERPWEGQSGGLEDVESQITQTKPSGG
jgi:hypothetical protein